MNRIGLFVLTLFSLAVSAFSEIPSEGLWPIPVVPQGRNPATFPIPFQPWLTRFQNNLNATRGKQFDLIFDGDSITDGWGSFGKEVWAQSYGHLRSYDFGLSGDKTEHLLWRLKQGQVDGMDPKLVVLLIGTNNVGHDSADQIAEAIKAITTEYLQRCPHAHLLLLGIFPRTEKPSTPFRGMIADVNKKLAALKSERVIFLNIGAKFLNADGTISREIMGDFTHPTAKGYQIWADAIQPIVHKYME